MTARSPNRVMPNIMHQTDQIKPDEMDEDSSMYPWLRQDRHEPGSYAS